MGDLHMLSHQSTQLGASIGDLSAYQTHDKDWDCQEKEASETKM